MLIEIQCEDCGADLKTYTTIEDGGIKISVEPCANCAARKVMIERGEEA